MSFVKDKDNDRFRRMVRTPSVKFRTKEWEREVDDFRVNQNHVVRT